MRGRTPTGLQAVGTYKKYDHNYHIIRLFDREKKIKNTSCSLDIGIDTRVYARLYHAHTLLRYKTRGGDKRNNIA